MQKTILTVFNKTAFKHVWALVWLRYKMAARYQKKNRTFGILIFKEMMASIKFEFK